MNLFGGLLFLQGHITNVALARQLAGMDAGEADADDGDQLATMPASADKAAATGSATGCDGRLKSCRALP